MPDICMPYLPATLINVSSNALFSDCARRVQKKFCTVYVNRMKLKISLDASTV